MSPDHPVDAADLDRGWDEFVLTGDARYLQQKDPETAALLQHLWTSWAPPAPENARARVWRRLQQRQQGTESEMEARFGAPPPLPATIPVQRNGWRQADRNHTSWRVMPGLLATAALVVFVLAASLVAGVLRPRLASPPPIGLPAGFPVLATATSGAVAEHTLLDVALPAQLLPQGERVSGEYSQVISPPGSTGSWRAIDSAGQSGLRVYFVQDGTLTMQAEGPSQVVRAGTSSLEDVPSGDVITLVSGDAWIARNETPVDAVNPTEAATKLLVWVLVNIEDSAGFMNASVPGNWQEVYNRLGDPPGVVVPAAPARLRIRLVELPVKGRLPVLEGSLQYALSLPTNQEGTPVVGPSIGNLTDGEITNIGRKPAQAYVLSLEPSATNDGGTLTGTPTH